jgi:hypothetical protein
VVASPVVASIIEPEELPEEEDVPDEAPLDELPPDDAPPPDAPAPDEPTSLVASPGPALPSVDELPPQPAATSGAANNAIVANVGKRKSIFIDALLGRGALRETAVDRTFPSAEVRCNWQFFLPASRCALRVWRISSTASTGRVPRVGLVQNIHGKKRAFMSRLCNEVCLFVWLGSGEKRRSSTWPIPWWSSFLSPPAEGRNRLLPQ